MHRQHLPVELGFERCRFAARRKVTAESGLIPAAAAASAAILAFTLTFAVATPFTFALALPDTLTLAFTLPLSGAFPLSFPLSLFAGIRRDSFSTLAGFAGISA